MKTKSLQEKTDILAHLLGAKEWSQGESATLGWKYYIEFKGVTKSAAAVQHGGTGEALIHFHSTRAMHAYLNDKIKLFKP